MIPKHKYDIVIVGGGFFGCCLALFLRSITDNILVVEQDAELLSRASRINQARVHTGFHYPRSFVTALRSARLRDRFAREFSDAIMSDFQMLYAIARRRSKVTSSRFYTMFRDMGAPIAPAPAKDAALFNDELVESAFTCDEFAFDWNILRDHLRDRVERYGIHLMTGRSVQSAKFNERCHLELSDGTSVSGRTMFNVTYSELNRLLSRSNLAPLPLKHELAEIALVKPPVELEGKAITVMDGPFFSTMPYPSRGLYSLTHVRYTPHLSWTDEHSDGTAHRLANIACRSRWRHMMMDGRRYVPSLANLEYRESLFTVKTVLRKNEVNDGRPIFLTKHHNDPDYYSILGGKIDNIYDLFDAIPEISPKFRSANARFLA